MPRRDAGLAWAAAIFLVLAWAGAALAAPITATQTPIDRTQTSPAQTISQHDLDALPTTPGTPKSTIQLPPAPVLTPVDMPVAPPSFCTEEARVQFLTDVFNPAAATATANATAAADHLGDLGRATSAATGVYDILTARGAFNDYKPIADKAYKFGLDIQKVRPAIMAAAIVPCGPPPADHSVGQPAPRSLPTPTTPPQPPKVHRAAGHGRFCSHPAPPINVGSNGRVGSGSRLRDKALSTALGMVGGLIGGAGQGDTGGADGPQTVTCRIKDSEMTVFSDPETGVSLAVGAKRSGDTVVVFAGITKSPDDGTFQAGYLQDADGDQQAAKNVGICDLWGEWSLTVSWTRETYVNDQLVSREQGGWSKSGTFHIPGILSSDAAPDGLWKRLGFSNASHGARKVALQFNLPPSDDPTLLVIQVTRPSRDPVTTVPFSLVMRETPGGFTFERAPVDCPPSDTPPPVPLAGPVFAAPPGAVVGPDGSWTDTYTDGTKTTFYPDGSTHTVFPHPAEGQAQTTVSPDYPKPGPGTPVNPDGSWTQTFNDGTKTTYFTDGSTKTVFPKPGKTPVSPEFPPPPAGTATNPDGSWTQVFSDGTKTTYFTDGSTRTVFPKAGETPLPAGVSPDFPKPGPGTPVNPDGSWTQTFNDGTKTTYFPDGSSKTVFPPPPEPPAPPQASPVAPPSVPTPPPVAAPPPPPLKTEPMFDRLETYAHDHPVEGVTSIKRGVSTEGDDALSGTVSYFAQGAEIYRADFNAQGDLIHAGQTPSGRARDMMKRFKFGRPGGDHGITAEALGKTSSGGEYIRHVSFTDDNGDFRGFMDFDQDGNLQRGIVYGEDGHVEARWDGPPDAPPAAAPKLPDLDQLNEDLDREDAEQRADDLKAWREEYPPEPAVAP